MAAEKEVPKPRDGDTILLLGDLDSERDALLQRRVDVDRVRERLGVELGHDGLEGELGAVRASDRQAEEGVEVEGHERAVGRVACEQEDRDLDEVGLNVWASEGVSAAVSRTDEPGQSARSNWTKSGSSEPSESMCCCTAPAFACSPRPDFATPSLRALSTLIQSILVTSGTANCLIISGGTGRSFSFCASSTFFANAARPSGPSLSTVSATRSFSSFSILSASEADGRPMIVTECALT